VPFVAPRFETARAPAQRRTLIEPNSHVKEPPGSIKRLIGQGKEASKRALPITPSARPRRARQRNIA